MSWLLDVDDDNGGDYPVDYSHDAEGDLVASVFDLSTTDPASRTCVVEAAYEDQYYIARGIEPSCIGGATHVSASGAMVFDDGSAYHFDFLANGDFPPSIRAASAGPRRASPARPGPAPPSRSAVRVRRPGRRQRRLPRATGRLRRRGRGRDRPRRADPARALLRHLPAEVGAEISRLKVNYVVALGGQSAICSDMLTQAARRVDSSGNAKKRIAGATRIETSVAISKTLFSPDEAPTVYLARQDVFADAVAAGSLTDGPVILVPTCGAVPSAVKTEVRSARARPGAGARGARRDLRPGPA